MSLFSCPAKHREGNFTCLMPKCNFILQVCVFPRIRPLSKERYPGSITTPCPGYPPTTRTRVRQRWHWCILPVKAPMSPQHAELHLLLLHPSPAFHGWFVSHAGLVITACANLQSAWLIFYPLTCLSLSKQMQGLQRSREDWRCLCILLSFAFTSERLALKGRNNFAVMEESGYAFVGERIQAPSQTPCWRFLKFTAVSSSLACQENDPFSRPFCFFGS